MNKNTTTFDPMILVSMILGIFLAMVIISLCKNDNVVKDSSSTKKELLKNK